MDPEILHFDSDEFEHRTLGFVDAARINDVLAGFDSKAYQDYLLRITEQVRGDDVPEDADQYRARIRAMLPHALDAYGKKHGERPTSDLVYFHAKHPVFAAPHAMDCPMVGITFHVRETERSYVNAVHRGLDLRAIRHAHAMMALTGAEEWLHIDFWTGEGRRRLYEHRVKLSPKLRDDMESALCKFAIATRSRYAA